MVEGAGLSSLDTPPGEHRITTGSHSVSGGPPCRVGGGVPCSSVRGWGL